MKYRVNRKLLKNIKIQLFCPPFLHIVGLQVRNVNL